MENSKLLKESSMRSFRTVFLILTLVVISGCYPGIKGRVVDGVTGQPLEGALVVAQWTIKHGLPGLQYHDLHKIVETLTDRQGVFSIRSTPNNPFVDPPEMIIYKDGYIPWRNDLIFPSLNTVKDNEWNNNMTYKLEILTEKYTAEQLGQFLNNGIIGLGAAPMLHKTHNKISDKVIDEMRAHKQKP